ncbi:MAG TPA: CRISPR-associated helicase Cas3' [Rhizomicrobium sp.]
MQEKRFAHSHPGRDISQWEPLSDHLAAVGERAAQFATAFGWAEAARTAGRLHDIGKCSQAFQDYIARPVVSGERSRGPDHSTAGAREAAKAYCGPLGKMLAFAIAGHHAGLADAANLTGRLTESAIEPYDGWQTECGRLPTAETLAPTAKIRQGVERGFTQAFLTRMLFSCLVDADFLETERFYAGADAKPVNRGGHTNLTTLRDRLRDYMERMRRRADATPVNALRARVLNHAVGNAALAPGLFTLTVPTGGGKTLASLSFALEHAVRHAMRRVIYVIPYTSIIEQTAREFRKALNESDDILEHHASFDWEKAPGTAGADSEGPDGLEKLRRAAENWDVPVVVTTAVQFFESLFAKRTSSCRKLHNIAGSVIVLDEVQTLPIPLLRPCVAAMDELARNYGASIVLCTATQPALRKRDMKDRAWGFEIDDDRELAPDPRSLYRELKRVDVETRSESVPDEAITARFAERAQMLCIVNSRAHARKLFDGIQELPGAFHLTTLMCPRHRRAVLKQVGIRLKDREPVRLVATSLIEAGVDVDFPEVWRAATGLDSIAQAAGRCNREGKLERGRTVVFTPSEAKPPRALEAFWQATRPIIRQHDDILGLEAIRAYFGELYWQKGDEAFDAIEVGGLRGILTAIRERANDFDFPFESIARAFRMIDEHMEPVIVPWKADTDDDDAQKLLNKIAGMDRPLAGDLRRLQQYVVSIPRKLRCDWMVADVLTPVHPALGSGLLRFQDLAHYRPRTGVDIFDTAERATEYNIIS